MFQILEFFFGKNIESAFAQKDDEINHLAENIIKEIGKIDIQCDNFQNNLESFIFVYGSRYLEVCDEIKDKFQKKSPQLYLRFKQYIQILIAKKFRKIAKNKQKQAYYKVVEAIKSKCKLNNPILVKKNNIRLLYEEYQQHYSKFLQRLSENQPQTMDWILIKYEQKAKNQLTYSLIENQEQNSKINVYKSLIMKCIHNYFSTQQFRILTQDHIIQLLQFGNKLYNQIFQDVQLGFEKFLFEVCDLNLFKQDQKELLQVFNSKEYQNKNFFFENFSLEQTIQLIVEMYIILSGFKFKNKFLMIEKYQTSSHAFLLKYCEQINNGKWEFTNSQILNLANQVMGDIYFQIMQQLNQNQQNQVIIQINNQNQMVQLFMNNKQTIINFNLQNSTYNFCISNLFSDTSEKCEKISNDYFSKFINEIIKQKHKDLQKYAKPEIFYLQSLSKLQVRSNIITIFANGFLTQKDIKDQNLCPLYQDSNLQTLILGWQASSVTNISKFAIIASFFGTSLLATAGLGFIAGVVKLISLFKECLAEAKKVGKYLAYFLQQNYLGTKTINLIGFSLGTVIVYYCLKQLIKFQKESNSDDPLIIHNVLMLGGVADKNLLSKLDYRCISGTFHNVYSRQDFVLTKVLSKLTTEIQPCGINPIQSMHPNVKNHNFTQQVEGHLNYKGKTLKEILKLTNFADQYLIL
ncbi:unnamed protein product [Paramecium sonneborni]|uniref:DUF726 domain-containing protein n=1 Tax=Paramecium sonneborni TaxID=65129 RepID=A0A8S1M915_9CILI|nr:unnamed protein product [Paramecium sonneborni]